MRIKFNNNYIKDLASILFFPIVFSLVYNFIVYKDFNFLARAKEKSVHTTQSEFKEVTIEEAQNYFSQAILIDARSEENYLQGHIPNSINIPTKNFDNYLDKVFELPQDSLLIIYCEGIHCNLSHLLAEKLKTFGFKNIWIMYEGIEGWKQKNLPIEK
ncbi:MAG: rhodanese-like domain-containing protein [Ignavibacteria bacterium]|nr:rhodanese-like domain-containing protein [Ignavibacteria bacterium]